MSKNRHVFLDALCFSSHVARGEKLLFVVHKSWTTLFKKAFKVSFMGIAMPMVLGLLLPGLWLIFSAWAALGFVWFFYAVSCWYLDAIVVTSSGLTDVNWRGMFDKSAHRVALESVSGVEYEKVGVMAHLFNYGTVEITVEGNEGEPLGMHYASDPKRAEQEIMLAREEAVKEGALESEEKIKDIISKVVKHSVRKEKNNLADLL